ncbi:2-amino-4-hydroxy-6-hydroxymethyldihydropteridine diphosphokinase [Suttonella sp. R2A3]|uniref:2-amino-4-hydroxy-6- hydroxymethyldihydropteridine diphosphokinase n=1 Tax=Suttonella sp. R2A3 TaxID=2908648 RepID=UPI001F2C1FF9|nr:2-amino-4-hydroxy-6-hydroxymethyldihydropteridine diphosphokinase [Suttonella sp. R2A3]UJF25123.1 2-amino-4-hydroxy-6-hydroxymethyldihydropteridine diphosphokinase [Suttonella sp. R2A3]
MKHRVWVAFGSNIEDPVAQLVRARASLAQTMVEEAASPLYQTPPFGFTEQPDFVNAVVRYRTDLSPHAVLALLMRTEHAQGRVRSIKNGPRTLDLDVLLYDDAVVESADLIVPHPGLTSRDFVLQPLAAIDAECEIPGHGRVADVLSTLASKPLPIIEDKRWVSP